MGMASATGSGAVMKPPSHIPPRWHPDWYERFGILTIDGRMRDEAAYAEATRYVMRIMGGEK